MYDKMPSKKQYDLVQNDDYDTRIPLHPEEAFQHGIKFQAKYIGMLDVPRPTSRVEIVAAMRRIRYEFKAKGIKKKKVTIEVSLDGVKVTLRKKKKRKHWMDDSKNVILNNPIYRIFYVSHDSQDLKIFSYIARDGASNIFKCAVFKSNKKSQAMRVVRTVGQAFEVCHKLSINAPENLDNLDQDEQDTLSQDLLSDRLSDITSDKPRRDLLSEGASDRNSLPPDDSSIKDFENGNRQSRIHPQLDLLPPPVNYGNRKSPLSAAETYSSPFNDALTTATTTTNSAVGAGGSGGGGGASSGSCSTLPPPGGALTAYHELQLMREQLEQQSQQTQAALAQLQLTREQLAAEQSARLEAQARTHQLLVHNRELLDHIAALVAHLQGGEKPGQEQTPPHMTMPQQYQHNQRNPIPDMASYNHDGPENPTSSVDSSPILQAYGAAAQSLIENLSATNCMPSSPLRTAPLNNNTNGGSGFFNFPQAPQQQQLDNAAFETQLLQRLQSLVGGYPQPQQAFQYQYAQTLPQLASQPLYNQPTTLLNNNYNLQPPPKKKTIPPSPLLSRNSYSGTGISCSNLNLSRNSEPRQLSNYQQSFAATNAPPPSNQVYQNQSYQYQNHAELPGHATGNNNQQKQSVAHLQVQKNQRQQRDTSPNPVAGCSQSSEATSRRSTIIKPLAQMGTLTTTDADGRVRVIVPVPSHSNEDDRDHNHVMSNVRMADDLKPPSNGPGITRSKSEKVPNRSQLMAEVQRTTWARHTTK